MKSVIRGGGEKRRGEGGDEEGGREGVEKEGDVVEAKRGGIQKLCQISHSQR